MQEDGGRIKAAGKMKHPGFSELDPEEAPRSGLGDLQLLRGRSQRLLVTSPSWSRWESKTWWWCPRRWVKEARSKRLISAMPGSCAIALDRYLRGHDKALSVVRVPTQEQSRSEH